MSVVLFLSQNSYQLEFIMNEKKQRIIVNKNGNWRGGYKSAILPLCFFFLCRRSFNITFLPPLPQSLCSTWHSFLRRHDKARTRMDSVVNRPVTEWTRFEIQRCRTLAVRPMQLRLRKSRPTSNTT